MQGINPSDLTSPWYVWDLEKTIWNAMSANETERILANLIPAAGLVPGSVKDRWEAGEAVEEVMKSR